MQHMKGIQEVEGKEMKEKLLSISMSVWNP
jgi:hypothetical protein